MSSSISRVIKYNLCMNHELGLALLSRDRCKHAGILHTLGVKITVRTLASVGLVNPSTRRTLASASPPNLNNIVCSATTNKSLHGQA